MKFRSVVMITGLSTWMWVASGAPDTSADSALSAPEKPLDELIQDLSDAKFRTREEASRKIWKIGDPALPSLERTAKGSDPEGAYRARELIRKINLHITPDTDPSIIQLVERYEKASVDEKVTIFDKLNRKRAWRQILKLYANEPEPETQFRLQGPLRNGVNGSGYGVAGVAVIAAREQLMKGDAAAAKEFLEMAPADATGLLALADFHRSQGTLEAELKRAKTLKGLNADAWQLALYRASGNLDAARDAATAAGEARISAVMSILNGDPVPWLELCPAEGEDQQQILKPYADLALRRWQGKPIRPTDMSPLMISVNSKNNSERQSGLNALFLLGESAVAEPAFSNSSPLEAFSYFETLEKIPEALKALDLDPVNPDYAGWVAKRFESLAKGEEDEDHDSSTVTQELIVLADFLERRGLKREADGAYLKPLAALAQKDEKVFTEFLGNLFHASLRQKALGAPLIASKAAVEWAGDDASRWEDVIHSVFGERGEAIELWDWMGDLDPAATRADRLAGMLALCDMGGDPYRLREKWMRVGWEDLEKTPLVQRAQVLGKMVFLSKLHADVAASVKLLGLLPQDLRKEMLMTGGVSDLIAAGKWGECADLYMAQISTRSAMNLEPQPSTYACAAACLRKAGRAEEAANCDAWVDKLALGNDSRAIAAVYAYCGDYQQSAEWYARAARQCDPSALEEIAGVFEQYQDSLMEEGKWKEVGAVSEALAQMLPSVNPAGFTPIEALGLRLKADLGRALANLKTDRPGSIAVLDNCRKMFPSDGSLADDFFPSLRKAGLMKEHDEWFNESWARMSAVLAKYPDSDNTSNTVAWMASRARRNLDQAEKIEERALAAKPEEASYLDTMAEIQFAKGNRAKALESSSLAVNFSSGSLQLILRRQHDRFRTAPLPR